MKYLFVLLICVSLYSSSHAQDSLKYRYAMLQIDKVNNEMHIEYSNGEKEDIFQMLHLDRLSSCNQILFRCFIYLNSKGYELVATQPYKKCRSFELTPHGDEQEYIFKKKNPGVQ